KKAPAKKAVAKNAKKATAKKEVKKAGKKTRGKKALARIGTVTIDADGVSKKISKDGKKKRIVKSRSKTDESEKEVEVPKTTGLLKLPKLKLKAKEKKKYYNLLVDSLEKITEEHDIHSDSVLHVQRNAGEELADIGSDNFLRDMELGLMNEEEGRMKKINFAIARLDEGTYGVCIDTGNRIQEARLEVIPWCLRSVEAQESYEHRKQMGIASSNPFFDE
ncbi:MAG: TraR/DksA family transcriptional regulator, partial [Lentisphaeria bacterium]|nr:TraR/DksA family transcriptional regulator [Lentisphaeria bacterium]